MFICALTGIIAVLKGNGRGLGAVPLARHCKALGVERVAMGTLSEGAILRQAGIEGTIHVFGKFS